MLACRRLPSFLYAMPFSANRVFLEETSLVARPAVPYEELKQRLDKRMAHMGIKVQGIEEEEYCLIPMGGALPRLPQRVLGIGGTGGMVHPSTGVALCMGHMWGSKVCALAHSYEIRYVSWLICVSGAS